MSERFVLDLAKSDLPYYYKQSVDGIEEGVRTDIVSLNRFRISMDQLT